MWFTAENKDSTFATDIISREGLDSFLAELDRDFIIYFLEYSSSYTEFLALNYTLNYVIAENAENIEKYVSESLNVFRLIEILPHFEHIRMLEEYTDFHEYFHKWWGQNYAVASLLTSMAKHLPKDSGVLNHLVGSIFYFYVENFRPTYTKHLVIVYGDLKND